MREHLVWRIGAALVLLVSIAGLVGVIGLAWFRRDFARRVALVAALPNVDLAYGAFWLVLLKTVVLLLRHPRMLLLGWLHAGHLLVGIDPLEALDDATLQALQRAADEEARRE
jgi:hypothetical protein